MSKTIKWIFGLAALAGVTVLLAWAFVESRKELAAEREREKPVASPQRVSRSSTGELVVTLDRDTQTRIALKIETLTVTNLPSEVVAYGNIVDPVPLLVLSGELNAANAAFAASHAEVERLRTLRADNETVSQKALDAAEAQFRADEARARTAQQNWSLAWCDAPLPTNAAALVLVDLPAGQTLTHNPVGARVIVLGHDNQSLPATVLCAEQKIESATQGQGYWLRVDSTPFPLRPGAAVTAYLALGEPENGVLIPRAGVVRTAGAAWAYVQMDDDRFTRRLVALDHPTERGWFTTGFKAGDRVVVAGAQMLLSEEMKSQIQIGEEGQGK